MVSQLLAVLVASVLTVTAGLAWAHPDAPTPAPEQSEMKTIHYSDVKKKRTVVPQYPAAAKEKFAASEPEQRCKVRMVIDGQGIPTNIHFESCDPVFHESTRDALMKWRFFPATNEQGHPVPAQFVLMIRYRLNDPRQPAAAAEAPPAPEPPKFFTPESPEPEGDEPPSRDERQTGENSPIHYSEVRKKKSVQPTYPKAATRQNLGDQDCKVRLFMDNRGVPTDLQFLTCHEAFHETTRNAVMKWRFFPAQNEDGTKTDAEFILKIKYRVRK